MIVLLEGRVCTEGEWLPSMTSLCKDVIQSEDIVCQLLEQSFVLLDVLICIIAEQQLYICDGPVLHRQLLDILFDEDLMVLELSYQQHIVADSQ